MHVQEESSVQNESDFDSKLASAGRMKGEGEAEAECEYEGGG